LKTSNLILDFEFDQHLGSHKHVINITMWFRDMGCYSEPAGEPRGGRVGRNPNHRERPQTSSI
jgi:hypothetical protein